MMEETQKHTMQEVLERYQARCRELTEDGCLECCDCREEGHVTDRIEVMPVFLAKREPAECMALVHKCGRCGVEWTCGATEEQSDRVVKEALKTNMIEAENFCETLNANVDNEDLSNEAFRQLARNTLPIVTFERPRIDKPYKYALPMHLAESYTLNSEGQYRKNQ